MSAHLSSVDSIGATRRDVERHESDANRRASPFRRLSRRHFVLLLVIFVTLWWSLRREAELESSSTFGVVEQQVTVPFSTPRESDESVIGDEEQSMYAETPGEPSFVAGLRFSPLECAPPWQAPTALADEPSYKLERHEEGIEPYSNYAMITFEVRQRVCFVILPRCAHATRPWILRGVMWTYRAYAELRLVAAGFHVVHCDTEKLLANRHANAVLDEAYTLLTGSAASRAPLNARATLLGYERGTVALLSFATRNPHAVQALVLDSPIYDMAATPVPFDEHRVPLRMDERCAYARSFQSTDELTSDDEGGAEANSGGDDGRHMALLEVEDDDCELCSYLHKMYRSAYEIEDDRLFATHSENIAWRCLRPLAESAPLLLLVAALDRSLSVRRHALQLQHDYREANGSVTLFVRSGEHRPAMLREPEPIINFVVLANAHELAIGDTAMVRHAILLSKHADQLSLTHAISRPAPYIVSLALAYECDRLVPLHSAGLDPDQPGLRVNASDPGRLDLFDTLWCYAANGEKHIDVRLSLQTVPPSILLYWALPRRLLSGEDLSSIDALYVETFFDEYGGASYDFNELDLVEQRNEQNGDGGGDGGVGRELATPDPHIDEYLSSRRQALRSLHRSVLLLRRRLDIDRQLAAPITSTDADDDELLRAEVGPDEFSGGVEGAELTGFRFAHFGRCVYASRLELSVAGVYYVHLVHLRDMYTSVSEDKKVWQPLSFVHLLGRDDVRVQVLDAPHRSVAAMRAWRDSSLPTCSTLHDLTDGRYVAKNGEAEARVNGSARFQPQLRIKYRASPRIWHHDAEHYQFWPWRCRLALTSHDDVRALLDGSRLQVRGDSHTRYLFMYLVNDVCGTNLQLSQRNWTATVNASMAPRCSSPSTLLEYVYDYIGWDATDFSRFEMSVCNFGQHQADQHHFTYRKYRSLIGSYVARLTRALAYSNRTASKHVMWLSSMPSMPVVGGVAESYRDWRYVPRLALWNRYAALSMHVNDVPTLDIYSVMLPLVEFANDSAHFFQLFAERQQYLTVMNGVWILMQ